MPELPEVQTTVNGLKRKVVGLRVRDAWSDYDSAYWKGSESIRDAAYFKGFRKAILGRKIIKAERRAKNILLNLSGGRTILVHMKMTGHLLYGTYQRNPNIETRNSKQVRISKYKKPGNLLWEPIEPESLKDPFNRHIHFMLAFTNGKNLALSDLRKFAKVTLMDTRTAHQSSHLKGIGPEPLEKSFTFEKFKERLQKRPYGKIKLVLMDQTVIAGIGNIYADESLWRAGIHPKESVKDVPNAKLLGLFKAIKMNLSRGINLGGDSMSDYRNIDGKKGAFQEEHHAYRKTGKRCDKKGCGGTIRRISLGGRGTHFCDKHQKFMAA